jgi:hypothetical protein
MAEFVKTLSEKLKGVRVLETVKSRDFETRFQALRPLANCMHSDPLKLGVAVDEGPTALCGAAIVLSCRTKTENAGSAPNILGNIPHVEKPGCNVD